MYEDHKRLKMIVRRAKLKAVAKPNRILAQKWNNFEKQWFPALDALNEVYLELDKIFNSTYSDESVTPREKRQYERLAQDAKSLVDEMYNRVGRKVESLFNNLVRNGIV